MNTSDFVHFLFTSLSHRQLCLDLVPRREFSMVDPDEISVTELYRLVNDFGAPLSIFMCFYFGRSAGRDEKVFLVDSVSSFCGCWFIRNARGSREDVRKTGRSQIVVFFKHSH